jgi:hypothetical protein
METLPLGARLAASLELLGSRLLLLVPRHGCNGSGLGSASRNASQDVADGWPCPELPREEAVESSFRGVSRLAAPWCCCIQPSDEPSKDDSHDLGGTQQQRWLMTSN